MRLVIISVIALALTGCHTLKKYDYAAETPQFVMSGSRSVAVATEDSRPYVVSAEKGLTFVGILRSGFGVPSSVTTASGKPLADDFSSTIARALEQKGFKSTAISVEAPISPADVRELIARSGAERLALVTINEWKSDTLVQTSLQYDVTLRIYDANGSQLAANRMSGNDNWGYDWSQPTTLAHAKRAVPIAYKRKLEELFASEAVMSSLR